MTFSELARLGAELVQPMLFLQMVLVLVAAPCVTAGAIGADLQRGLLSHVLISDLTSWEIVAGKLVGRLMPLALMLGCSLPMLAILVLLGGVNPDQLFCAYLVMFAVLALGGAVGLACSLVCRKTHEALILALSCMVLWLLIFPISEWARWGVTWLTPVYLFENTTPRPDWAWAFSGVVLGVSVVLVLLVTWQLRRVCARDAGVGHVTKHGLSGWAWSGLTRMVLVLTRGRGWLRPSLDANPVLWREWQRRRPSWVGIIVVCLYVVIAGGFTLRTFSGSGTSSSGFAAFVNGFQSSFVLLLLVVIAATTLSEERARGSLDVLLATPLSTSTILWGKWLGTFRNAVPMAVFPMVTLAGRVMKQSSWELSLTALLIAVLAIVVFFGFAAAIVSGCLLLATKIARQNRVMIAAVVGYLLVAVGWIFLSMSLTSRGPDSEAYAMLSPFMAMGGLTFMVGELHSGGFHWESYLWAGLVLLPILSVSTLLMMLATWWLFERSLGRMPETVAGTWAAPRKPPTSPSVSTGAKW